MSATTIRRAPGLWQRVRSAAKYVVGGGRRAFYQGAETNRLNKNFRSHRKLHPNTAASSDGATIRARLRQLNRDNPIVAGARRSFKTSVLPSPILVEPDVKRGQASKPSNALNTNWNNPMGALWKLWRGGNCDWFGWESHADTFEVMQSKGAGCGLFDGEFFAIIRRRSMMPGVLPEFQLELATSDRLDDSRITATTSLAVDGRRPGIEYDANGRPAAYWFSKNSGGGGFAQESERIPAADVIHVIVPSEPGEHIGELPAASVLMPLRWLHEMVTSEFSIRAIMSKIGGIITGSDDLGAGDSEEDENGKPFQPLDIEDATILRMSEGEFHEWNMQRPGAQWKDLVEVFLRWISAGLGIPYSILASNFTGLNYSVSKAERQSNQPFLDLWRRDIMAAQFVCKVYQRFVRECVAQGIIAIPGTLTLAELVAHRIRLPRTEYIDPLKDAQADLARMRMGESPQRVFGERGLDFYEEVEAAAEALDFVEALREGQGLPHLTTFAPEPGATSAAITKQIEDDEKEQAAEAEKSDLAAGRMRHVA